jgi:uncharacterized protein (TIGR02391 family)
MPVARSRKTRAIRRTCLMGTGVKVNLRLLATQLGDSLKYQTSLREVERIALSIFPFQCEDFPNDAITSVRARSVYNWIMTLGRHPMTPAERTRMLVQFARVLSGADQREHVDKLLAECGIVAAGAQNQEDFSGRGFHADVVRHGRKLFLEGNYFHAVFEVAKVYNKQVREKAHSAKDGQPLMLEVWGWERGVLKVTPCETGTDKNVQDGIRFLSAGLMQAIRNPTAHEPAMDWPISRQDCLDILSFLSFLFRKLDDAVYVAPGR